MGHTVSAEARAKMRMAHIGNRANGWNPTGLGIRRGRAAVRIVSGWVQRARAVWVQHNGPICKGMLIHHRDENKLNDKIENLKCMTNKDHTKHHRLSDR
ncbi:hypothetical protein LCGC14_1133290 [marine sediment metagenome]|uniref:HNH nuclease domain-containing protein n=1 Tax=marine sediment metagenome TaxID=412755 RepID=A0A0F9Q693_9ZZZZ